MFRRKIKDDEQFIKSRIRAKMVLPNRLTALTVDDVDILLTRLDGEIIAFSGSCPHAAADLGDGTLHRDRISCPLHGWKFDLRSGRTLWPEDETCRLSRFPIKIVDGVIWVRV
ncbi:MAG: Rieske (2Fe-2S) protein [Candidatus Promineifilaceae bacterium]